MPQTGSQDQVTPRQLHIVAPFITFWVTESCPISSRLATSWFL